MLELLEELEEETLFVVDELVELTLLVPDNDDDVLLLFDDGLSLLLLHDVMINNGNKAKTANLLFFIILFLSIFINA